MREIGASQARTHFSALLDEVARGATIVITRRGRPMARLTPPEMPRRETAVAAAATLRDLRQRVGWATNQEILQMRNRGRR